MIKLPAAADIGSSELDRPDQPQQRHARAEHHRKADVQGSLTSVIDSHKPWTPRSLGARIVSSVSAPSA